MTKVRLMSLLTNSNLLMGQAASETESYLSQNEADSDSVSVLFLLLQQSHINKKMYEDFQITHLMEVIIKAR